MLVDGMYDISFIGVRKFSIEHRDTNISRSNFTNEHRLFISGMSSLNKEVDKQNRSYYVMVIKGWPELEVHFDDVSICTVQDIFQPQKTLGCV